MMIASLKCQTGLILIIIMITTTIITHNKNGNNNLTITVNKNANNNAIGMTMMVTTQEVYSSIDYAVVLVMQRLVA